MITERNVVGKIEILENGCLQVRTDTIIERDGVEIARTYHRAVLEPDAQVNPNRPVLVGKVIDLVWTEEVKLKYADSKSRLRLVVDAKPGDGIKRPDHPA